MNKNDDEENNDDDDEGYFNDNSLHKSMTSNSRSSTSDKFNKLQKLERKNIIEEDNPTFTMTKDNLNLILK